MNIFGDLWHLTLVPTNSSVFARPILSSTGLSDTLYVNANTINKYYAQLSAGIKKHRFLFLSVGILDFVSFLPFDDKSRHDLFRPTIEEEKMFAFRLRTLSEVDDSKI